MINSPIIPTFITVHIGAPEEAGRNINVPFVEYIKNVASGEIYPNWPVDSIKANVLAIISFALNRIYNEWYRSLGYNFDITSSSQYDQSFGVDRQFFEKISIVVDELFNDYIVKDGQVQPLFAQYCDGRITKCSGLSQWGTVSDANSGLGPINILKKYYGNNINIIYNASVEDNIMSFPGFNVELGTSGNFVKMLKVQLNRIGQNYPAIPVIKNDSVYFTVDMVDAVKKFQEVFNLKVNGIVDKSTWYKIKYIYNAVKKISDIYSEGISIDEASLVFSKKLVLGDKGKFIRALNYYLNTIAYFDDDIPFFNLSGDLFTEDTLEMVISFQNKYNISSTGEVNQETWKLLREKYRDIINNLDDQYVTYLDEFFPGRYLSRGMKGKDVLNLQKFLYIICKNRGDIPGVEVSSEFDRLTEDSVKFIQEKYGLLVNGVVGPSTWYKIVELSKE